MIAATEMDDRDAAILAERSAAYDEHTGPRVGDYVRFADDKLRRISYIWRDEHDTILPNGVQTSDGGSYYLGNGHVSMSGSLFTGVDVCTLTLTDETRKGRVWFFHHDWHTAGGGVDVTMPFRVFTCSLESRRF